MRIVGKSLHEFLIGGNSKPEVEYTSRHRRDTWDISDQSKLTTKLGIAAITLGCIFVLLLACVSIYRLSKYFGLIKKPNLNKALLPQGQGRDINSKVNDNDLYNVSKRKSRARVSRSSSLEKSRVHPRRHNTGEQLTTRGGKGDNGENNAKVKHLKKDASSNRPKPVSYQQNVEIKLDQRYSPGPEKLETIREVTEYTLV